MQTDLLHRSQNPILHLRIDIHSCLRLNPAQVTKMPNIKPIKTPIPIPFPRASLSLQSAVVAFGESGET